MGPLYGKMFHGFSGALEEKKDIGIGEMGIALDGMLLAVQSITPAKPGDKTLIDALYPAVEAFQKAMDEGADFSSALAEMKSAARAGRDSTKNMLAKLGRASRLGERSRGVPDAGATSCCLLLETISDTAQRLLEEQLS